MDGNPIVRGREFGPEHGENDPDIDFAGLHALPNARFRIDQLVDETNLIVKMLSDQARRTGMGEAGPMYQMMPKSKKKAEELVQAILVTTYTERFLGFLVREYSAPTDTSQPRKKTL